MVKPPLINLLDAMRPIVRKVMLTRCSPDCCIATCKSLREVFAYYGYRTRALPVKVAVYNAGMLALLDAGIPIPDDARERVELFNSHAAWGVVIGPGAHRDSREKPGFPGHLILQVDRYIVDASIDQAARPAHHIFLPELLYGEAPAGFFSVRARKQRVSVKLKSCRVVYERLSDDSYRNSPNWREPDGQLYEEILSRVSIALDKQRPSQVVD